MIAVDGQERIPNYSYVYAVQEAADRVSDKNIHILSVTPWDKFVPALNALVSFAAVSCQARYILFVSAETSASESSMQQLKRHMVDKDTLVIGALLSGHDYRPSTKGVALNGRTTPWNTLALWNVPKLALTGVPLIADGLHLNEDGSRGAAGVEEVATIAVLQKILGADQAKAKLVKLADVEWDQTFEDEERRKWHEQKMNSKVERAARQLELLGLEELSSFLGSPRNVRITEVYLKS